MKVVIALVTVVLLLGVVYGLAFIGIIPCKTIAAKSPAVKPIFIALKLIKPDAPVKAAKTTLADAPDPLAGEKADIETEKLQLAQEKAQLDQKGAQAAAPKAPAAPPPVVTSSKVSAIYDTMKPEQLATLFAKLPDAVVCDALIKMDEDKAGKVLVAMPPDRAAKLTTLMNQATANAPQTDQQPPS